VEFSPEFPNEGPNGPAVAALTRQGRGGKKRSIGGEWAANPGGTQGGEVIKGGDNFHRSPGNFLRGGTKSRARGFFGAETVLNNPGRRRKKKKKNKKPLPGLPGSVFIVMKILKRGVETVWGGGGGGGPETKPGFFLPQKLWGCPSKKNKKKTAAFPKKLGPKKARTQLGTGGKGVLRRGHKQTGQT